MEVKNTLKLLFTNNELIPAGCKRPECGARGVKSTQVDGRFYIRQR
jgi:hypothetical protein